MVFWLPVPVLKLCLGPALLPQELLHKLGMIGRGSLCITENTPAMKEIPSVLGSLCPELGAKAKVYFLLCHTIIIAHSTKLCSHLQCLGPSVSPEGLPSAALCCASTCQQNSQVSAHTALVFLGRAQTAERQKTECQGAALWGKQTGDCVPCFTACIWTGPGK